jgi:FlaA1/EpsC-like NDP-sugar epimerase
VISSLQGLAWRDFLARPALSPPSPQLLDAVARQPILITGAGGSIGSALALRLAHFALPGLVLLEAAENSLCRLERGWAEDLETSSGAAAAATFILGDAGDRAAMEEIVAAHRPRLVFHAAAHKHVLLLEQQPWAAIANNIFATETVAAVAAAHRARVVLLSTDKAVEPASVMGATKRVAEEIVLAHGGTVLRLVNVLASSGSVAEVFAHQIARGVSLTVTDPAARRYFLTMDEAVNLLLFAAGRPESSTVLAPALPAAHGIVELAGFMARALAPGREIPICFTGLRPGDRLAERLWEDSGLARPAGSGDLLSVQSSRPAPMQFESGLAALRAAARERNLSAALAQLRALVPGFHPSQTVLALAREGVQRVYA